MPNATRKDNGFDYFYGEGDLLVLEYDLPLSVNHYLGHRAFMNGSSPQVSVYVTTEAKKYKIAFVKYVQEQIKKQKFKIILDKTKFIHVDATWFFPRIDMDANNMWKLPLDCLTEAGLWVDDNIVLERTKKIVYDSVNPKMHLEIYYSKQIGIFDGKLQYDLFKSNCLHCRHWKNGKCGVHHRSLQNHVAEEIDIITKTCAKYEFKEPVSKTVSKNPAKNGPGRPKKGTKAGKKIGRPRAIEKPEDLLFEEDAAFGPRHSGKRGRPKAILDPAE